MCSFKLQKCVLKILGDHKVKCAMCTNKMFCAEFFCEYVGRFQVYNPIEELNITVLTRIYVEIQRFKSESM